MINNSFNNLKASAQDGLSEIKKNIQKTAQAAVQNLRSKSTSEATRASRTLSKNSSSVSLNSISNVHGQEQAALSEKITLQSILRYCGRAFGLVNNKNATESNPSISQSTSKLENEIKKLDSLIQKELSKQPSERNFENLHKLSLQVQLIARQFEFSGTAGKVLNQTISQLCDDIKSAYPGLKKNQTPAQKEISAVLNDIRVELLRKGSINQLSDYVGFINQSSDSLKKMINAHGKEYGVEDPDSGSLEATVAHLKQELEQKNPFTDSDDYQHTAEALMQNINYPINFAARQSTEVEKPLPNRYFLSAEGAHVTESYIKNSKSFAEANLEVAKKPLDPSKPPPAIGKEAPHIFSAAFLISKKIYSEMSESDLRRPEAEVHKNRLDEAANKPDLPKDYPKLAEALAFFASV